MQKVYNVKNLDCGSCAAKIERAISKLDGVENAQMNFMTQKLSVEASEDRLKTLLPDIEKAAKKIERGVIVSQ